MLRIALCDDDPGALALGEALIQEYLALRPGLGGSAAIFSSGETLLEKARGGGFDVYLLDVILPGENGIELGRQLRRMDQRAIIIYLTSSPDFAVDSYSARAFYYLLKPVDKRKLFDVLDGAASALAAGREEAVLLRCRDGIRRLTMGSIVYGELRERRLCYQLSGGERVESVSLREPFRKAVAALLEHRAFAQCAASFVVNLAFVARVGRESVYLADDSRLPLSRSCREAFTRRWLDYHLDEKPF